MALALSGPWMKHYVQQTLQQLKTSDTEKERAMLDLSIGLCTKPKRCQILQVFIQVRLMVSFIDHPMMTRNNWKYRMRLVLSLPSSHLMHWLVMKSNALASDLDRRNTPRLTAFRGGVIQITKYALRLMGSDPNVWIILEIQDFRLMGADGNSTIGHPQPISQVLANEIRWAWDMTRTEVGNSSQDTLELQDQIQEVTPFLNERGIHALWKEHGVNGHYSDPSRRKTI
jgi:hypothetical protein